MVDRPALEIWAYRGLFLALALVSLALRLVPYGGADEVLPGPDLVFALVLAWTMRRPEFVPSLLIALVFVLEDFLVMRPPGLWAAAVLLACEFLRSRTILLRELNFVTEWLLVAALMLGAMLGYRLILGLALVPQPGLGLALIQSLGTIFAYPLVALASATVLGVHKPAMGEVSPYGRRL